MKKLEIVLLAFVSMAALANIFGLSFPGMKVLMFLLVSLLCVFYAWFGFLIFNGVGLRRLFKGGAFKGISVLRILGAICFGISVAALLMGILFRSMHWPGGLVQVLAGMFSAAIISIIAAVKYAKTKEMYYSRILIRAGIFIFFGILALSLVPSVAHRGALFEGQTEFSENPQRQ